MIRWLIFEIESILAGAAIAAFLLKIVILAILVFAVIGLITTIKFFVRRRNLKKETDGEYFMRTGRLREKK